MQGAAALEGLLDAQVGYSGASAITSNTTVVNNLLSGSEWLQTEKAREHGADVLSCRDKSLR